MKSALGEGFRETLGFPRPTAIGRYDVLRLGTWRRGHSLPGCSPRPAGCAEEAVVQGQRVLSPLLGVERQGSNWQEGPLGAGQLFQELVWLQLRGKQERKKQGSGNSKGRDT